MRQVHGTGTGRGFSRRALAAGCLGSAAGAEALLLEANRLTCAAGNGQQGYSGDGGPASTARLNQPFHCCFGPKGEMYVADTFNHVIRRVDPDGRISTVAGCGRRGYEGDHGPAKLATMNEPYGVVCDAAGDLFIVDRLNACVRRVDGFTGLMTTLAGTGVPGYSGDGGPANLAQLREPNGLALDRRGGLLIADVSDNRIRRVDLGTARISTVAGTGARRYSGDGGPALQASIEGARAVDTDPAGNLIVCEREGNRVRMIDGQTGMIRTIAGTGLAGYTGDGGPALQATFNGPKWVHCDTRGDLYVVDTENHCVRRIVRATGRIETVMGSGKRGPGGDGGDPKQAEMDRPHGCWYFRGRLYVADTNNHRVRVCRI